MGDGGGKENKGVSRLDAVRPLLLFFLFLDDFLEPSHEIFLLGSRDCFEKTDVEPTKRDKRLLGRKGAEEMDGVGRGRIEDDVRSCLDVESCW